MQTSSITINGEPLKEYINTKHGEEINKDIKEQVKELNKPIKSHITTKFKSESEENGKVKTIFKKRKRSCVVKNEVIRILKECNGKPITTSKISKLTGYNIVSIYTVLERLYKKLGNEILEKNEKKYAIKDLEKFNQLVKSKNKKEELNIELQNKMEENVKEFKQTICSEGISLTNTEKLLSTDLVSMLSSLVQNGFNINVNIGKSKDKDSYNKSSKQLTLQESITYIVTNGLDVNINL